MPSLQKQNTNLTLKTFRDRLIDTGARSKLLLLRNLRARQDADLAAFDQAAGKSPLELLDALLLGEKKIKLCSQGQTGGDDGKLSEALKNIQREAKGIQLQTGSDDLCLAWPFVQGRLSDGATYRAPLLLIPVEVEVEKGFWYLKPRQDEPVAFNQSLLVSLSERLERPEIRSLLEAVFELGEEGQSAPVFKATLYNRTKEVLPQLTWNPDVVNGPLKPFRKLTKADTDKQFGLGILRVEPEAVLGLFPQADSYLMDDYERLMERGVTLEEIFGGGDVPEAAEDLEEVEAEGEEVHMLEPNSQENMTPVFPLQTDGSQEKALEMSRGGRNVLVEGPPGTGKSQLISNLTADRLARGEKVMLVCQKRAALDVVYNRLREIGLADFVALVHDYKTDRAAIYAQLKRQIDNQTEYLAATATQEAALTEARLEKNYQTYRNARTKLEDYRRALYETFSYGISAHQLYLKYGGMDAPADLSAEAKHFNLALATRLADKLTELERLRRRSGRASAFWKERPRYLHPSQQDEIKAALAPEVEAWRVQTAEVLGEAMTAKELERLYSSLISGGLGDALATLAKLPGRSLEAVSALMRQPDRLEERETATKAATGSGAIPSSMSRTLVEMAAGTLKTASSGMEQTLQNLLEAVEEAARVRVEGGLGALAFPIFNSKAKTMKALAGKALPQLGELAQLKDALNTLIVREGALAAYRGFPLPLLPDLFADEHTWRSQTQSALMLLEASRAGGHRDISKSLTEAFLAAEADAPGKAKAISTLLKSLGEWRAAARTALSDRQVDLLSNPKNALSTSELKAEAQDHFDTWLEHDRLLEFLSDHETAVLAKLEGSGSDAHKAGLVDALWVSLAKCWLGLLEEKHPVLRQVSSPGGLEDLSEDSLSARKEWQALSAKLALHRAMENSLAPTSIGTQRFYRDVNHEVGKKRRVWPMRELMRVQGERVLQLAPCWLVSPETASAIFPMTKGLFDLVIFDEASQCFSERGVPAAYRGRHLLVTGDSKQLQPFSLFQVGGGEALREGVTDYLEEDELEEAGNLEALSLLDLAARHIPNRMMLTGHYRSRYPELIQFSNRHFYENRLHALPHYRWALDRPAAFVFEHHEGEWLENTNRPEAERVVERVFDLTNERPDLTLGVVTFNQPQQNLISDLLEEEAQFRNVPLPQSLFVKNIENVQGDERDVIIFSVAYAPGADGKLRQSFGSLQMKGGENRLNVAASRAREQIQVFTSIRESDFRLDSVNTEGVRSLAGFLGFAERAARGENVLEGQMPAIRATAAQTLRGLLAIQDDSLKTLLPFADLTRIENSRYQGLVFTDDEGLELSPSAWEHLVGRPARAQSQDWPVWVALSRQYYQGRIKARN